MIAPEILLREMLETPSISGQEQAIAELLVQRMREQPGLRAWRDEAGNAVGVMGDGPEEIVLLGHMDTAPGWVPVRQEGDLLYGRGAVDAKGPLAAFIAAVAQVGPRPGKRFVVIGAVEEECPTSRGARYAATQYRPSAVIIGEPSNWDRVTLGYKGSLTAQFSLEQEVEHGSGPNQSVAERGVEFWLKARDYARQRNGDQPRSFKTLDPALRAFNTASDGLHERVEALLAYRVPVGCTIAELEEQVKSWEGEGQITFYNEEEPFQAERNNALVRAFLQAIRDEGGNPRFAMKHGTSDMNIVGPAWGCPILAYGPGDSRYDHTPREQISLTEFRQGVAVLTRVLRTL